MFGFHDSILNSNSPISGRYRPSRILGKGGMGWVVEAEDILLENQKLVLKFLFAHLIKSEKALSGFRNEVLIARRLIHPGIVRTHNFSQDERFGHFIVMEYVRGSTLKDAIRNGEGQSHSPEFVLKILRDLLLAIGHAHSFGVIHLDIKPENIFLSEEYDLKLGDFGLSQSIRSTKEGHGKVMGTPLYMAPEQFRGEMLSPRTDIYSIGIVLHHLISGKPPFEANSVYALGRMHMDEIIPCLRKKRPDIPEWVHALIEKCAEKSIEDRFRSVDEIILTIQEMGVPVLDEKVSPTVLPTIEGRDYTHQSMTQKIYRNTTLRALLAFCICWYVVFSGRNRRWLHGDLLYFAMQVERRLGVEMHLFRSLFHLKAKFGQTFHEVIDEEGAVEALVWSGAPLRQIDPKTGVPFLMEMVNSQWAHRMVPLLLSAGADPNQTDSLGQTALHILRGPRAEVLANLFVARGADVNHRDNFGVSPLLGAVKAEEFALVRVLINCGADPLLADNQGVTPLGYSRLIDDERIRALLEHPPPKRSCGLK